MSIWNRCTSDNDAKIYYKSRNEANTKFSEPRMVNLRHSHKLYWIRSGRYKVGDRLYDRCGWRCRHHTNLIALELACHYFSALDNVVDVGRTVRAEGEVKRPWLTSTVQPSHNFVASEQAKLLLQTKIGFREAASNDHDSRCKDTFGEERPNESLHVWREPEGNRIV